MMTEPREKRQLGIERSKVAAALPLVLAVVLLCGFAFSGGAVAAQGVPVPSASGAATEKDHPVALPEHLTRSEVRDLLSRLSDDQVRQLLLQQLDKVAEGEVATAAPEARFADSFKEKLHIMRGRLALMHSAVRDLPTLFPFVLDRLTAGEGRSHIWTILLFTAIVFAGGAAGEWLFKRMFSRFARRPTSEGPETTLNKVCLLVWRGIVDVLGIAVFGLCAAALFFVFYQGHAPTQLAMSTLFWMVIFIRLVSVVSCMALAPRVMSLRLPPLDTETAQKVYRRIMLMAGAIIVGVLFMDLLDALGISEGLSLLVGRIVSFVVFALVVGMIWYDRKGISGLIRSGSEDGAQGTSRVKQLLAGNWHVLATCYVAGIWVFSTVTKLLTGQDASGPAIVSLFILLAIPLVDWLVQAALSRVLHAAPAAAGQAPPADVDGEIATLAAAPGADQGKVEPSRTMAGRAEYYAVLLRNVRIVLAIVAVVVLAAGWELDVRSMASKGMGETIAGALFDIIVAVVLASAGWGIVKTAINQKIQEEQGAAGEAGEMEGEGVGKGGSRLQTLLPLFRKFLLITLVVIVILMVLSELGVDIGPLIAGAGVVGIAIGFGAQTLVKDIVSGLFFLMDDAFRVGEYIDVGSVRGVVEKISIRSLRLRHQNGPVHTVPFGEIQHLTNYSRDWAIMKLEVRVPFDTDMEKVRKIVKKVGQELVTDPEHGKNFLQPLKSQGVNRMDDSAFIVRVKFMAKPGEQFLLRREVFRRIQEAFSEQGIKFAPRRVIVDTGGGEAGAAAAAAAHAIADSDADAQPNGAKA